MVDLAIWSRSGRDPTFRGRRSPQEHFGNDPTTRGRSSNVSAPERGPVKGRRSLASGRCISGDYPGIVEADGQEPPDSSCSSEPNTALLREGGLQFRVGLSSAIPSGIVEADGKEPPDSSGSPEPARLKEGTSRSPQLCSNSPAARTSIKLVMPVQLITRSCHPCRDLVCPLFEDRLT